MPCSCLYCAVMIYLPILDRNHGKKSLCRSLIGFFYDAGGGGGGGGCGGAGAGAGGGDCF